MYVLVFVDVLQFCEKVSGIVEWRYCRRSFTFVKDMLDGGRIAYSNHCFDDVIAPFIFGKISYSYGVRRGWMTWAFVF